MSTGEEQRRYPRVASGVRTGIRRGKVTPEAREYLDALATNVGHGGIYIETARPFAEGEIVELVLELPHSGGSSIEARGIVRWRNGKGDAQGMGIEFIDFHGLGQQPLDEWLAMLLGRRP